MNVATRSQNIANPLQVVAGPENGSDKPIYVLQRIDGLNERQEAFLNAYIKNEGNALEAARTAGYSGTDETLRVVSWKLLRHPKIVARLKRTVTREVLENGETVLVSENVQEKLIRELDLVSFAKAETKLTYDAKLRAIELNAKIRGMLKEGSTTTHQTLVINGRDLGAMSEAQLIERLSGLRAKAIDSTVKENPSTTIDATVIENQPIDKV